MNSIVRHLADKGHLKDSKPFISNTSYEVIMGSHAYGIPSDNSDIDIYAFTIPPQYYPFPFLLGHIEGFEEPENKFHCMQKHHILEDNKIYDVVVYNIVSYFKLCMQGNPNMIDSLFVPDRCILFMDNVGKLVRDNRHLFLSKKCWHTFKGYAYSQLNKARSKNPVGKRAETVEKYGWDVKFGYHLVRLIKEVECMMLTGDMDLERNADILSDIRAGNVSFVEVENWFKEKEIELDELYYSSECKLPDKPDKTKIKTLLLLCLEEKYGSLPFSLPLDIAW